MNQGTKILCYVNGAEEYLPIETLRKGTLVKTLKFGYRAIEAIGSAKIYNPGNTLHGDNRLYKCSPTAYPTLTEDLFITGNHSILEDTLTNKQEKDVMNTFGKVYVTEGKNRLMAYLDQRAEPYAVEGMYTVWNLALENPSIFFNNGIYANGLIVETASIDTLLNRSCMVLTT